MVNKISGKALANRTDVTERKQMEEKLVRLSHQNELILNSVSEGILGLDLQGNHTFVNPAAARMLGYEAKELLGRPSHSTWHHTKPDGSPYPQKECGIYAVYLDGVAYSSSNEVFWKKDGSSFPVEYTSTPIYQEGQLAGAVVTFDDITERKKAEEALRESEQRYKTLFESAAEGILIADIETNKFKYANSAICTMLGYSREELTKMGVIDIHPKTSLEHVLADFAAQVRGEKILSSGLPCVKKDGTIIYADIKAAKAIIDGTECNIGFFSDVTERKQAEEEANQANKKLMVLVKKLEQRGHQNSILAEMRDLLHACTTMEEIPPIIMSYMKKLFPEAGGAIFLLSPSRSDLESVARWGDFSEDVNDNVFAPDACWALRRGRVYVVENINDEPICPHLKHPPSTAYACLPLVAKSDVLGLLHLRSAQLEQTRSEQNMISDLKEMGATLSEYLSLSIANMKLSESLAKQSVRDSLTGLFNRRYMEESLQREILRAARKETSIGIVMADIDYFKQFNDNYGHIAGDKLLAQLGDFFRAKLRGADVACRYGGEEFTIILPDSSIDDTFKRAEMMREEIHNLGVHYRGELLAPITISMGISAYPGQGTNAQDILRIADVALYRAKQEGRNRVIIG